MKIDRLLGILMQLINKQKVTAKQLADYYEVSVRTIQRDMDTLGMAGIPLYADVGKNGGYALLDNYKLNSNFLKKNEANILIKFLENVNSIGASKEISSIYNKFQLMNTGTTNDEKLVIELNPLINNGSFKSNLNSLSCAIDSQNKVHLEYVDVILNETGRVLNPYILLMSGTVWYVYGYCELRADFRMFKISRIISVNVLEEKFKRIEMPKEKPWGNDTDADGIDECIILKIDKRMHGKITDVFDYQSYEIKDDQIFITMYSKINEWLYSTLLSLTPYVQILEPAHLKKSYLQKLESGIDKNS